jgi:hypothetical protein
MLIALVIASAVLMVLGWWRAAVWKHRYLFEMETRRLEALGPMQDVHWGRKE